VGSAVGGVTGGLGEGVGKLGKGDVIGSVGSIGGGVYKGVTGLGRGLLSGAGSDGDKEEAKIKQAKQEESVAGKNSFF
jgi:hypothetical protein